MSTQKRQKSPLFDPEEWITPAQAARIRGITRQAMAGLIKKGRFATFEIGERVFVRRDQVSEYETKKPGRPKKD